MVILEQLTILRKEVRVDDLPKLYKRAFERELERIILAQILAPSLSDQHLATNVAYARYFTLLATDPSLVLGEKALDELPDDLSLPTAEARALLEIIKRHRNVAAVSHRIVADDLRELGIKASERNLAVSARVTASGYRDANVAACSDLAEPLNSSTVWPLPKNLQKLATSQNDPVDTQSVNTPSTESSEASNSSLKISQLAEETIAERIANDGWRKDRCRDVSAAVAIFIAANGDLPVIQIRQAHLLNMVKLFSVLPVHYGRNHDSNEGRPRKETVAEAAERGRSLKTKWDSDPILSEEQGLPYVGLSLNTQKKHLTWISALFTHLEGTTPDRAPTGLNFTAVRRTLTQPKNQSERTSVKKNQKKNEKRLPWLKDELKAYLNTPIWSGCAGLWHRLDEGDQIYHDGAYWVPLLLVSTTARANEIAGMRVSDVILDDGIPHLYIRENGLRGLKNHASIRRVPIAEAILALGFVEYARAIGQHGHKSLFPEFEHPTMEHRKCFYKDVHEPLMKRTFPSGTSQKRGRKDVDIHSIRTLGIDLIDEFADVTKERDFDLAHRIALSGHEPERTREQYYRQDLRPERLKPQVEFLASSLLPQIERVPLQLRPKEYQKFGKPLGRHKQPSKDPGA